MGEPASFMLGQALDMGGAELSGEMPDGDGGSSKELVLFRKIPTATS